MRGCGCKGVRDAREAGRGPSCRPALVTTKHTDGYDVPGAWGLRRRHNARALALLDEALEHTPTLVELHTAKAKVGGRPVLCAGVSRPEERLMPCVAGRVVVLC